MRMEKISGIYAIEFPNGEDYIGKSVDIPQRWRDHRSDMRSTTEDHHNIRVQRCWDKYGTANWVIKELCQPTDLITRERQWMTISGSLNLTLAGGEGGVNTPEIRAKISATMKAKLADPIEREKFVTRMTAHVDNEDYREGLRTRQQEKLKDPSYHEKLSEWAKRKRQPYPSLRHRVTGEVIPEGVGMAEMCRQRCLHQSAVCLVIHGKQKHHKGWELNPDQF